MDRVSILEENGCGLVRIELFSGSILLDLQKKNQSFQDTAMTYEQVIQQVLADTPHAVALLPDVMGETPIGSPLIQYRETDWEFCRRLVSHFGTSLLPELSRGLPCFWAGKPVKSARHSVLAAEYTAVADRRFYRQGGSGQGYRRRDFMHYDIVCHENREIGETVEFLEQEFLICAKSCKLEQGLLAFTYTLAGEGFFQYNLRYNEKISGMSLLGTVLETASFPPSTGNTCTYIRSWQGLPASARTARRWSWGCGIYRASSSKATIP